MTWVKLDDSFPTHPKVVAAGEHAAWLYVCALCYAAHHLTDGHVPAEFLRRLTALSRPERLAARLVDVGLWEVVDGGWLIHDFGSHQRSRVEVERERERTRDRVAKYRTKQSGNAVTSGVSNGAGNAVSNGDVRMVEVDTDTEPRSFGNSPRLPASDGSDRPTGAGQVMAAIAAKCGEPVLGDWAERVQAAVGRAGSMAVGEIVETVSAADERLRMPGLCRLVVQFAGFDAPATTGPRVPEWAPDVTPIAADAAERAREIAAGLRGER